MLPERDSVGGYPLIYITKDGGKLCPDCANNENGSEAITEDGSDCPDNYQWLIVDSDIHWEGAPITCDHCYKEVESAYGDSGDPDEENP